MTIPSCAISHTHTQIHKHHCTVYWKSNTVCRPISGHYAASSFWSMETSSYRCPAPLLYPALPYSVLPNLSYPTLPYPALPYPALQHTLYCYVCRLLSCIVNFVYSLHGIFLLLHSFLLYSPPFFSHSLIMFSVHGYIRG